MEIKTLSKLTDIDDKLDKICYFTLFNTCISVLIIVLMFVYTTDVINSLHTTSFLCQEINLIDLPKIEEVK